MTAAANTPPLPEVFGNYALGDFVEVVPPQAISWLPQTAGWLWLAVALSGILLHYAWVHLRRWYQNRYRREAADRLRKLVHGANSVELVSEINQLLKLTALVAYSREEVARLWGDSWVNFLNRQCATPPFSKSQRQLLALGSYHGAVPDPIAAQQLITSSLKWINEHEGTGRV
ncbi:MAG: DUF4381 domain-containing protein [Halieaceae bacterium]|jgi:hypothetical protein|nr:DUF4381 domain-containing protein [Halieaceae bacterium]